MKNHHFQKQSFWNEFYKSKEISTFEWYQTYDELRDIFRMAFNKLQYDREKFILDMGVGSSEILD